ncbi:MAG: hypothetical protein NT138_20050 [Planctomycetales bacterium]|nr:hypothetical protein [Planctomycetales bacterium]
MSAQHEFAAAWDRLSNRDLKAIAVIGRNMKLIRICPELMGVLMAATDLQIEHTEALKTKPSRMLPLEEFSNTQVISAYQCSLAIEIALKAVSGKAEEWAGLLRQCICTELCARLEAYDIATSAEMN